MDGGDRNVRRLAAGRVERDALAAKEQETGSRQMNDVYPGTDFGRVGLLIFVLFWWSLRSLTVRRYGRTRPRMLMDDGTPKVRAAPGLDARMLELIRKPTKVDDESAE